MNIIDLQNLLIQEINRFNILDINIDDLKVKIYLLNEVFNFIDNHNYEEIYDNNIMLSIDLDTSIPQKSKYFQNEFYKSYYALMSYKKHPALSDEYNREKEKLKDLKQSLKEELEDLKKLLEEYENQYDLDTLINYKRIKSNIRFHQYITNYQQEIIKKLLDSKNISDKNIVILFEKIKNNNLYIKEKINDNYQANIKYRYEILNMLNMGFEKFTVKNINDKSKIRIKKEIKKLFNIWNSYYEKNRYFDFVEQFPTLNNSYFSREELEVLYSMFMNRIQDELLYYIKMISDKEFYFDREIKKEIVFEFKKLMNLYRLARKFYDEELKEVEDENEFKEQLEVKNHLLFLKRNDEETYFERNLEDIPQEYYERVIKLLEAKRYGIMKAGVDDKHLVSSDTLKYLKELKDDQVRIVYTHIQGKYYKIIGVFTKKEDVDLKEYRNMSNRNKLSDVDYDHEEEIYQRIINYCNNNRRIGNR